MGKQHVTLLCCFLSSASVFASLSLEPRISKRKPYSMLCGQSFSAKAASTVASLVRLSSGTSSVTAP
jgi:hypothetical protein